MNILFTCAGRRNYLLEYFKEATGGKGSVIAADMSRSAPAMAVADIAHANPIQPPRERVKIRVPAPNTSTETKSDLDR